MSIITVGTSNPVEIDTSKLPASSIEALIRRGLSHVLGNEVASKVASKKKAHESAHLKTEGATADTYEAPGDDVIQGWYDEARKHLLDALNSGTLGVRSPSAPALDPLDAEMSKVAKEAIKVILAKQAGPDGKKLSWPKVGESVTFANGQVRTGEEMISNYLAKNGDEVRKIAQTALKAKAARAKAVEKSAEEVEL